MRKNIEAAERAAQAKIGVVSHVGVFALVAPIVVVISAAIAPDGHWYAWPLLVWAAAIAGHAVKVFAARTRLRGRIARAQSAHSAH